MTQFLIITLLVSVPLYSQENNSTQENKESNQYEQRKQAIKDYIRQEREKGKSVGEIYEQKGGLQSQSNNTVEGKAYNDAHKIKIQIWEDAKNYECRQNYWDFIDTPSCKLIESKYIEAQENCEKLQIIYENTPERQISSYVRNFLLEADNRNEKRQRLLKETQKIEKEIKALSEKKQHITETTMPELFRIKQNLLYSLSLY